MARATSSLPEPEGPEIITRLLVGATFSISWRRWFIAAEPPISSVASPARSRSVLDLAAQLGGLERPLGDQHEAVRLERLLDVVVGAALDRRDRGLDVAVAGDHHDRQVGMLAP